MTVAHKPFYLVALAVMLWAGATRAETVLITPEEAALPPSPVLTQRGPIPGPRVEFTAPKSDVAVKAPFALGVVFGRLSAADVDPKTVHIIVMRGDGVDVTDRVRGAGRIDHAGIDLKDLAAPPGEYRIRVTVHDTKDRPGFADLILKVAGAQ